MIVNPLVSILINNYNYAQFLKTAIDSALAQTYSNVEVIVVDDGSTDNSREVMALYGDSIQTVLKENEGQASAFNAGFEVCKGGIICFLDSDDAFLPGKALEVVQTFERYPDSGWFFHPLQKLDVTTGEFLSPLQSVSAISPGEFNFKLDVQRGHFIPYSPPATSGLCFRRDLLTKILPMPKAEGITLSDLYLKKVAMGLSIGYVSDRLLAYQGIHDRNAYTNRDNTLTKARIAIHTAYWVRRRYPEFSGYTNNQFARGLYLLKSTKCPIELRDRQIMEEYLTNTAMMPKFSIKLRTWYHQIRALFQKQVC